MLHSDHCRELTIRHQFASSYSGSLYRPPLHYNTLSIKRFGLELVHHWLEKIQRVHFSFDLLSTTDLHLLYFCKPVESEQNGDAKYNIE